MMALPRKRQFQFKGGYLWYKHLQVHPWFMGILKRKLISTLPSVQIKPCWCLPYLYRKESPIVKIVFFWTLFIYAQKLFEKVPR